MRIFCIAMTALSVVSCTGLLFAEEWTEIESNDASVAVQYSPSSIQHVSTTARRARTRFVSKTGKPIPRVNVYSVVSETEYYCPQPLEKLLTAQIVSASGEASPLQTVDPAVYSEIPHGSNSFRLWLAICSTGGYSGQKK